MTPFVATAAYIVGLLVLFAGDRERKRGSSLALWIPIVWLSIGGSRVVSAWLDPAAQVSTDVAYLEGNPVDRNVQATLMFLGLVVLVARRRQSWDVLRLNIPILMFFLYSGLSILWSDFPFTASRRWIKALGDLVMVLVVVTDPDRAAMQKLPARVGFVLIPLSILLMKYYPDLARAFNPITGEPEYTGVATSKNGLGMACLLFGLGSVWRFLEAWKADSQPRLSRLIVHGVIIAMVAWLFSWADSMTSLFSLVLATALLLATSSSGVAKHISAVNFIVASVLFGVAAILFLGFLGGVLDVMGRDSTLTGRTEIWRRVLEMDNHLLLGTGFESFWLGPRLQSMLAVYRGINQAHNGYIEVFLNLGATGLFLLGIALASGYSGILAALRNDPNQGRFRLAYFVVGILVNFTEASFKMMSPSWVLLLLSITKVPQQSVVGSLGTEWELKPIPTRAWRLTYRGAHPRVSLGEHARSMVKR